MRYRGGGVYMRFSSRAVRKNNEALTENGANRPVASFPMPGRLVAVAFITISLLSACTTLRVSRNENISPTTGTHDSHDLEANVRSTGEKFTELQGDYLGQTPPGDTPVVFAPGFISRESLEHGPAIFSADGNEVYWCARKSASEWLETDLWSMKRINNRWTAPEKLAPFGIDVAWMDPFLSKDGKRLYFSADTNTIKQRGLGPSENRDIWFIEKQKNGWSKPQKISAVINTTDGQSQPTFTNDGTVYFLEYLGSGKEWRCDILKSKLKNGNYLQPVALPENINLPVKQTSQDWTPFIAPDDSYLIFSSSRERKYGDLYISFHDIPNDTWSEPIGLGESINTESQESYPTVSPDGKYLFFTRYNGKQNSMDVFWVSTRIIDKLKAETH